MIRYLAELAKRTDFPPELALSSHLYGKEYNIYVLEFSDKSSYSNYWTNWGGYYNDITNPNVELFFSRYLQKVEDEETLKLTENTFYIVGSRIYINLPKKPWLYPSNETELDEVEGYSSFVRDATKLSDDRYTDATGNEIRYPVKLQIPSINNRLSDAISGTGLQGTFKINFNNDDGFFDNTDERNYENTPCRLKRYDSDDPIPTLSDFKTIRFGLIESVFKSANRLTITGADIYRTLTESVTRKFNTTDYPNLPNETKDKDIPVAWGTQNDLPLFEVDTNKYVAIDPNYQVSVDEVYDKDGATISYTVNSKGVISATDADSADVSCLTDNRIGQIITNELEDKGFIPYVDGPWDKTETDSYLSISARINLYFASGNLKKLITEALKNDNAFFMTKNDGRLTLRQWGQEYSTHDIDSWRIMQVPTSDTAESKKLFMSSVSIKYGKREKSKVYDFELYYDDDEAQIFEDYRKRKNVMFETVLASETEAEDLAERLVDRLGNISELMNIPLGVNTVDINMLDKINLDVKINDRQFSNFSEWIVRGVNPGQDVLILESV